MLCESHKKDNVIPVITPNWDHSPRSEYNAMIFHHSNPELWGNLVKRTLQTIAEKPDSDQIIMIRAWNEWGEGNYVEPDQEFGHGWLDAIYKAINNK